MEYVPTRSGQYATALPGEVYPIGWLLQQRLLADIALFLLALTTRVGSGRIATQARSAIIRRHA